MKVSRGSIYELKKNDRVLHVLVLNGHEKRIRVVEVGHYSCVYDDRLTEIHVLHNEKNTKKLSVFLYRNYFVMEYALEKPLGAVEVNSVKEIIDKLPSKQEISGKHELLKFCSKQVSRAHKKKDYNSFNGIKSMQKDLKRILNMHHEFDSSKVNMSNQFKKNKPVYNNLRIVPTKGEIKIYRG